MDGEDTRRRILHAGHASEWQTPAWEERDDCRSATEPALTIATLYYRYASSLHRYFSAHLGNAQEAEDLTALTFTKAVASIDRYQEQGHAASWLFGIARHTLLDHQRRRRSPHGTPTIEDPLVETLADPAPLQEEATLQAEQAQQLHDLLRQLPVDQRDALILRFFNELSVGETAATLGRSAGAVKMLVHRALASLRSRYEQTGQDAFIFVAFTVTPLLDACGFPGYPTPALQPASRATARPNRRR